MMLVCALATPAGADSDDAHEPTLAMLGAEWGLTGGESAYGPAIGIETTPFGGWLEFEAAFQPMFRPHHTEWQTPSTPRSTSSTGRPWTAASAFSSSPATNTASPPVTISPSP
ncbi:MAG: hypothetical protein ISS15_09300 [Alphaproteobacteria bacterium]|nr:hypothetical protein [Alphaproteobacteria bacterium]MBL7097841.1 hypothetical protein [Alphaproteobacteria bacterium]